MPRITTQELLLSGWHGIYTGGKQYWSHPDWASLGYLRFPSAASMEKALREYRASKPTEQKGE